MSQTIHPIAREQVRRFVELLWAELPADWNENQEGTEFHSFEMQLWLACFDVKIKQGRFDQLTLLAMARKRAENYYRTEFCQPHHDPKIWAFFRFRLELALLVTAGSDLNALLDCYHYHDITAGFAHRISHEGRERLASSYDRY